MVSELDAARYETRKLEFFRDGSIGAASSSASFNGTELGSMPVPLPSVINADVAFDAKNIEATIFEALWTRYGH
jgi:hypothetical protein